MFYFPVPAAAKAGGATVAMVKKSTSQERQLPMPASYEEALRELETLVGRLDAGQLPLDDLLAQYQRGAALLQFCRDKLAVVEQQIQVLENGEGKTWSADT